MVVPNAILSQPRSLVNLSCQKGVGVLNLKMTDKVHDVRPHCQCMGENSSRLCVGVSANMITLVLSTPIIYAHADQHHLKKAYHNNRP